MKSQVVDYCAAIGRDPLLVQGAGGNVSWKEGDTLWVKASGTWIADAAEKDIFVAVDLADLRRNVAAGNFNATPKVLQASALRPSIETLLHGLMPHPLVVHVHAIEALARLVRRDFAQHVASRMPPEMKWIRVDYRKPGEALARAIHEQLSVSGGADVIFLQNHGIVVGGENVAQVEARLGRLIDLLATPVASRPAAPPSAGIVVGEKTAYAPLADAALHQLALDPALFGRLGHDWVLYPDHVVFLGHRAHVYDDLGQLAADAAARAEPPELIFVRGLGVFALPGFSAAKQAQLRCYFDVITRQPDGVELAPLSAAQIAELLDWDAERYRQQMAK